MDRQKDLSTLPTDLKLEVAKRIARHFKDGAFEFDLNIERHIVVEGSTVFHGFSTSHRMVQKVFSAS